MSNEKKQRNVTRQQKILQILASGSGDPEGWVSKAYLIRAVWPELWSSDIRKGRRNLSSQLTYLKRRGVVTEYRTDPWERGICAEYIRLARAGPVTGDPE